MSVAYCQINGTKIGNAVWATTNLNVPTFRNGDRIKQCQSSADWEAAGTNGTPAWCLYVYDTSGRFGYLYNAHAVLDPRKLAPAGWHIPSRSEFRALWDTCGGEMEAAVDLKSRTDWVPYSPGGPSGGSDTYGFNWKPAGFRYGTSGVCVAIGYQSAFWSSEADTDKQGYAYFAYSASPWVQGQYIGRSMGFSVRVVQDPVSK